MRNSVLDEIDKYTTGAGLIVKPAAEPFETGETAARSRLGGDDEDSTEVRTGCKGRLNP
ncbi:hypothetical protein [Vulgatibacter incomptus]|uniref:hypothetical protein n=1 Tax=Vulgatibacter incomptus TaxID=1391653 RepID=UPI0012F86455|nr:hypothetical protein [Vulgatibacter incomptus]